MRAALYGVVARRKVKAWEDCFTLSTLVLVQVQGDPRGPGQCRWFTPGSLVLQSSPSSTATPGSSERR